MKDGKLCLIVVLLSAAVVNRGWACACGCGVFEVGTGTMLPEGPGGMVSVNYDFQDQGRNWHGSDSAPASNNEDKDVRTHFVSLELQYMFNRMWGVQVDLPYWNRRFRTEDGTKEWWGMGDMRVKAIYTGFAEDLSTGLTLGFKLPTGDFSRSGGAVDIDRDTQIGSGSTDILLGGFHRANFTRDNLWTWFVQAELDVPVLTQAQYTPGTELDAAAGIYYTGIKVRDVSIVPIAQVIGSERTRDSGANSAHPVGSGYQRILLSPGIEIDAHPFRIYGDAEFPVLQSIKGNQLVAPVLFKVSVSYMF